MPKNYHSIYQIALGRLWQSAQQITSALLVTKCLIIESLRSPHGSDASLKRAIDQWVDQYNDGNSSKLTKAILQTVVFVANHLFQEQAVLLPWALQSYEPEYAGSVTSAKVTIETGDSTVTFTGRWLLHQLIEYLNCYMCIRWAGTSKFCWVSLDPPHISTASASK